MRQPNIPPLLQHWLYHKFPLSGPLDLFRHLRLAVFLLPLCSGSNIRSDGRHPLSPWVLAIKLIGCFPETGNKSSEGAMEMDERISKSKIYSRVILYFCYSLPHSRTVLSGLLIRPIRTLSLRTRAMYILIWTATSACLPLRTVRNEKHRISCFASLLHRRLHQHIMQCGGKIIDSPASPTPFFFPDTLPPSAMVQTAFKWSRESGLISVGIEGQNAAESKSPSSLPTRTTSLPLIFVPLGLRYIFTASPSCLSSLAQSSLRIPQAIFPNALWSFVEGHSLNLGMAKPLQRSTMAVPSENYRGQWLMTRSSSG